MINLGAQSSASDLQDFNKKGAQFDREDISCYAKDGICQIQKRNQGVAMEAFKNFKIAAYVYAYYLKDADDAEIQRGIDYFKKYIHLDKVYIENHRGVVDIPPQRLREVKALFEKNGIETSGGITSTQLVDGQRKPSYYDTFCYTDPATARSTSASCASLRACLTRSSWTTSSSPPAGARCASRPRATSPGRTTAWA